MNIQLEITVDTSTVAESVHNKVNRMSQIVETDSKLKTDVGEVIIRMSTPYVPKKTGKLRESAHTDQDGYLVWRAYNKTGYDYATKQYTTQYAHYTTPGTGPRWIHKVDRSEFKNEILPILVGRLNNER